ncbi:MAG: HepT-like ribonuclease domain-containing protein [Spirochaetota bacterium]
MLAECRLLDIETEGLDEIAFVSDEVKKRAFARSVEIIGEAVKGLPSDLILSHPDIPWRRIASMRDRLIHADSAVDYGS